VAEEVRKRRHSTLQLPKNSFDGVPISVATHLKSESRSLQRGLEVLSAINEKDSGFDIVIFSQFAEEDLSQRCRGRGKQPDVKQIVSLGACSVHKSKALVQPIRTAKPC
jgi:hypothetical protein